MSTKTPTPITVEQEPEPEQEKSGAKPNTIPLDTDLSTGPEPQRADGVHLWGHLSAASILGPVQRTTTRIDS